MASEPSKRFLLLLASSLLLMECSATVKRAPVDPQQLEALVEQQAETISQLQAKLASMETEMATLKQRVAAQEAQVAFNVRLTGSTRNITGGETLLLDLVDLNRGNGYDTDSGVFTAPVSGLYLFSLHITHTPPGRAHFQIMKNGNIVAELESSGDDPQYMDRSSNSVVIHLNSDDRVWVRMANGNAFSIQALYRSAFAGVLVAPDP